MEGPVANRSRPVNGARQEVAPFYSYRQTSMDRAVVGGLVYRGQLHGRLAGMYVFGDNNSSTLRAIDPVIRGEPVDLARTNQLGQQGLTGILTSPEGELLVLTLGSKERPNGRVLQLSRDDRRRRRGSDDRRRRDRSGRQGEVRHGLLALPRARRSRDAGGGRWGRP